MRWPPAHEWKTSEPYRPRTCASRWTDEAPTTATPSLSHETSSRTSAAPLQHGERDVWTFLIRTPELVETGVRNELRRDLDQWHVRKETIPLGGANMTVAPDLVFGYATAIADIKYKLSEPRWRRADLYEVVAFATAAGAARAAIIEFRHSGEPEPPTVEVGPMDVRHFAWLADDEVLPEDAATQLASNVAAWLIEPGTP